MHMQKQYKHDSESSIIQETAQLHTTQAEMALDYAITAQSLYNIQKGEDINGTDRYE